MWSKLSSALKPKSGDALDSALPSPIAATDSDTMSRSLREKHSNIFRQASAQPSIQKDKENNQRTGSISFRKRASHLLLNKTNDHHSISGFGTLRSNTPVNVANDLTKSRLSEESSPQTERPSYDSLRSPLTHKESKYPFGGSTRSILRDPNTPGTGQNVRFFSRQAGRQVSASTAETSAEAALPVPGLAPVRARPSLAKLFVGHGDENTLKMSTASETERTMGTPSASQFYQLPPPELTGLFDMNEIPPIPRSENEIADNAVEVQDTPFDDQLPLSIPLPLSPSGVERDAEPVSPTQEKPEHNRSHSFSFGQSVFHSISTPAQGKKAPSIASSSSAEKTKDKDLSAKLKKSRSRAFSGSGLQSLIGGSSNSNSNNSNSSPVWPDASPEADINDPTARPVTPEEQPDPFNMNATAYYTPNTPNPPSPEIPSAISYFPSELSSRSHHQHHPTHTRGGSKDSSASTALVVSLHTQLALSHDMRASLEADLAARDELVSLLQAQAAQTHAKVDEQRRAWKRKVVHLEKICASLQEEVERSREEVSERSVMDEASAGALRALHTRVAECERREATLAEQVREKEARIRGMEKTERELRRGIAAVKEEMESFAHMSGLASEAGGVQVLSEEERERFRALEKQWEVQRAQLVADVERLKKENEVLLAAQEEMVKARRNDGRSLNEQQQLDRILALEAELRQREEAHAVLQAELEAQWGHTERANEKISSLEGQLQERAFAFQALQTEHQNTRKELEGLRHIETDYAEKLESEHSQIWEMKEELEAELNRATSELMDERARISDLKRAHADELAAHEDRASESKQQLASAQGAIAHLERTVTELNTELATSTARMSAAATSEKEKLAAMQREHTRVLAERTRALEQAEAREAELRGQMEWLVQERALVPKKDDKSAVEMEKLKEIVQELKHENAAKEVKIVQLTKARAQDKEDLASINIALDSKQQELELIKRKLGVRGTGGSVPTAGARSTVTSTGRRSSVAMATPSVSSSRPPSAMSDASGRESSMGTSTTTTTRTTRISNPRVLQPGSKASGAANGAAVGPPPPSAMTAKHRISLGTPTPANPRFPSMLSRGGLNSTTTTTTTTAAARRMSSVNLPTMTTAKERVLSSGSSGQEKENVKTPRPLSSAMGSNSSSRRMSASFLPA